MSTAAKWSVFLQTGCNPNVVLEGARPKLRSLDPTLTLEHPATMEKRINDSNVRRTFQTSLLVGFAAVATVLVLGGLYGLIAYSVKARTAEIAIRLAIGSSRERIALMLLAGVLRVTLLGVGIGLSLSLVMMQMMNTWLFTVTATDPLTFAIMALFVLGIAVLACLFPMRSATRIEPAAALRME